MAVPIAPVRSSRVTSSVPASRPDADRYARTVPLPLTNAIAVAMRRLFLRQRTPAPTDWRRAAGRIGSTTTARRNRTANSIGEGALGSDVGGIGDPAICVRTAPIWPRAGTRLPILWILLPILYAAAPRDRAGEQSQAPTSGLCSRRHPSSQTGLGDCRIIGLSLLALPPHSRPTMRPLQSLADGRARA
jgi:hypothetical protein